MAAAIPFIMMAMTVAGTVVAAQAAAKQGKQAKDMAQYNAQIADRNAGIAREQAATDADAQRRHAGRVIGAARAAYGASGITSEGSPLDVLEMSAANAELDNRNILYKGELRAMGYDETAVLDRYRGDAALDAGYERAGSAIIMGAGKAYSQMPAKSAQTGYNISDYQIGGGDDYRGDA